MSIYRFKFRIPQKNNPWFYDSVDATTLGDAKSAIKKKYPNNTYFEVCPKITELCSSTKQIAHDYTPDEIALIDKKWKKYQEKLRGELLDRTRESTYRLEIMTSYRLIP